MPSVFGVIPWGHHINIFTKSDSLEEALFYINKVATEGWSRTRLEHEIDARLFLTKGAAITNFNTTLPELEQGKRRDER